MKRDIIRRDESRDRNTPAASNARNDTGADKEGFRVRETAGQVSVKRLAAVQKLARRPKMSLNLPLSGCVAVKPIRYPDPSHEIIVSESNSAAIVAERVDVMVLSAAARNVAIQVAIMPAMILGLMGLSELHSEWGSRGRRSLFDIVKIEV